MKNNTTDNRSGINMYWQLYGTPTTVGVPGAPLMITCTTPSEDSTIIPPTVMTATSTTISGQTYGNGTYTASASSALTGWEAWRAFRTYDTSGYSTSPMWHSNGSLYNLVTGVYTGTQSTTDILSVTHQGEWLQIALPNAMRFSHHVIIGRAESQIWKGRNPRTFIVLGALDNTLNWYPLQEVANYNITNQVNVHNGPLLPSATSRTFTYFRIVVKEVGNVGTNGLINGGDARDSVNMFWQVWGSTTSRFPSAVMTDVTTTVSNQRYGNGAYSATGSSDYGIGWEA